MMRMKQWAALILALALPAALLAGCGAAPGAAAGQGGQGRQSTQQETLVICVEENDAPGIKQAAALFRAQNPGLKVELTQLPSLSGAADPDKIEKREAVLDQLSVEIMAGKGPDLFIFENALLDAQEASGSRPLFQDLVKTMAAGVFADWNAILEESGQSLPEDYLTPLLAAGRWDGGQYLLPISCDVYGFLLDAAGRETQLAALRRAETFSQLLTALKEGFGGFDALADGQTLNALEALLAGAGLPVMDETGTRLLLTADAMAPQLAAMDQVGAVITARGPAGGQPAPADAGLYAGRLGFTGGVLQHAAQNAAADAQPALAPLPMAEGGVAAYMRHWAGVRANSAQKQNALAFVQLLLGEDMQSKTPVTRENKTYTNLWMNGALPVRAACWAPYFANEWQLAASKDAPVNQSLQSDFAAVPAQITAGLGYDARLRQLSAALVANAAGPAPVPAAQAARQEMDEWGRYLDE